MNYTQTKANMKQTEDKSKEQIKEPTLPVFIPMGMVRWGMYSCFMAAGTLAFLTPPSDITVRQWICLSCILGHFASQLNALINKKQ